MKITALEEYGLRCILQLARNRDKGPVTISEIAKQEGLSLKNVAKLMWRLRKSGLIESVRGASGGYVLAKSPDQIMLSDILSALGGGLLDKELCNHYPGNMDNCMHLGGCGIRPVWSLLVSFVYQIAQQLTLAQLVGDEYAVRQDIEKIIKRSAQKLNPSRWKTLAGVR